MIEVKSETNKTWHLIKKIGEGVSGDSWLANNIDLGDAIVKRPSSNAIGTEVTGHAIDIINEGLLLKKVGGTETNYSDTKIKIINIIDWNISNPPSKDTFVVLEIAQGVSVKDLIGLNSNNYEKIGSKKLASYLKIFSQLENFPKLLTYRIVSGISLLLQKIHNTRISVNGKNYFGFIWNDIKTDHIFWDPVEKIFTVIDWGNAKLLSNKESTEDFRFSKQSDYKQFCQVIGQQSVLGYTRDLHQSFPKNCNGFDEIKLSGLLQKSLKLANIEIAALIQERRKESLFFESVFQDNAKSKIENIHNNIVSYGESPDESKMIKTANTRIEKTILSVDLDSFRSESNMLESISPHKIKNSELIEYILRLNRSNEGHEEKLSEILEHILEKDWGIAFWKFSEIKSLLQGDLLDQIFFLIRQNADPKHAGITPLSYLIQIQAGGKIRDYRKLQQLEEIINNWRRVKTDTSSDWLSYEHEEKVIASILNRKQKKEFNELLKIPIAKYESVLFNWNGGEFGLISRVLRSWNLYDPDRILKLNALDWYSSDENENNIQSWIESVNNISIDEEDFISEAERLLAEGENFRITNDIDWFEDLINRLNEIVDSTKRTTEKPRESEENFGGGDRYDNSKNKEYLESFYSSLKTREYDEAITIADKFAAIGFHGYSKLVEAFKNLEYKILKDSKPYGRVKLSWEKKNKFLTEDDEFQDAKILHDDLRKWFVSIQKAGIKECHGDFISIWVKYPKWSLPGGLKSDVDKWGERASRIESLTIKKDYYVDPEEESTVETEIAQSLSSIKKWVTLKLDKNIKAGEAKELKKLRSGFSLSIFKWKNQNTNFNRPPVDRFLEISHKNKLINYANSLKNTITLLIREIKKPSLFSISQKKTKEKFYVLSKLILRKEDLPPKKPPINATQKFIFGVSSVVFVFILTFLFNPQAGKGLDEPPPKNNRNGRLTEQGGGLSDNSSSAPVPTLTHVPSITQTHNQAPILTRTASPAPTLTHVPSITPTHNQTHPPTDIASPSSSIEEKCSQLERWGINGMWERALNDLLEMGEEKYAILQEHCDLGNSYVNAKMGFELSKLDSNVTEADIQNISKTYFPTMAGLPPREITAIQYIEWLKVALELCQVPEALSVSQANIFHMYLSVHKTRFADASDLFNIICNDEIYSLNEEPLKTVSKNIIVSRDMPVFVKAVERCVFNSVNALHVRISILQTNCIFPDLNEMDDWDTFVGIETRMCIVDGGSLQNGVISLLVDINGYKFGIKMEVADFKVTQFSQVTQLPFSTIENKRQDKNPNVFLINCKSLEENLEIQMVEIQMVKMGNLVFWLTVDNYGKENFVYLLPQILPNGLGGSNDKYNIVWALSTSESVGTDEAINEFHIYSDLFLIERME